GLERCEPDREWLLRLLAGPFHLLLGKPGDRRVGQGAFVGLAGVEPVAGLDPGAAMVAVSQFEDMLAVIDGKGRFAWPGSVEQGRLEQGRDRIGHPRLERLLQRLRLAVAEVVGPDGAGCTAFVPGDRQMAL